jgi:hypothetical protein
MWHFPPGIPISLCKILSKAIAEYKVFRLVDDVDQVRVQIGSRQRLGLSPCSSLDLQLFAQWLYSTVSDQQALTEKRANKTHLVFCGIV